MCVFQGVRSVFCKIHWGVPQGSVISPVLFNFFVRNFPMSDEVITSSYADDFNELASDADLDVIDRRLNGALRRVSAWAKRKNLSISAEKSCVTFFTTDPHQHHHHPQVFYLGALLPLNKNPKILGVTLDPHFTFGPHVKAVVNKLASGNKVLKALAGSDWGHSKEDLLRTYKSLGALVINYAAPIFSPCLKPSHVRKLQTMQNHCLRVVTGSHAAASTEHLHHETMVLPVDDHLQLLSRQSLATSLQRSHPSFKVVSRQPGPRQLRHTLTSKHSSAVAPFLRGGAIPPGSIRDTHNDLHTSAVAVAISKMDSNPNRVLKTRPPPIHGSEQSLPRHWRTTLSQLRSGFCRALCSYRSVVDQQTPNVM